MNFSFVFLAVGAGAMTLLAFQNSRKVRRALKKRAGKPKYLPRAISMLVLTAQISEMLRVVEHVSVVNVAAAVLLLAIVIASKSGTEGEPR